MQRTALPIVFISVLLCLISGGPILARDQTPMIVPIAPQSGLLATPMQLSAPALKCTEDSQCQQGYRCQAIMGEGTACPALQKSPTGSPIPPAPCTPSHRIIQGVCKPVEGNSCREEHDCYSGFICHAGVCAKPVVGDCSGPEDKSCPAGYTCTQKCGPPVSRYPDNTQPGYDCLIDELAHRPRNCPICLAATSLIATPSGQIAVTRLKVGMQVWSRNKAGERIVSRIAKVSSSVVPENHNVVDLVLTDGREVFVSPNHPTVNGIPVGTLRKGDKYDGSNVRSSRLVPYRDGKTLDLLPDSDSGMYWANDVPLNSTLK